LTLVYSDIKGISHLAQQFQGLNKRIARHQIGEGSLVFYSLNQISKAFDFPPCQRSCYILCEFQVLQKNLWTLVDWRPEDAA